LSHAGKPSEPSDLSDEEKNTRLLLEQISADEHLRSNWDARVWSEITQKRHLNARRRRRRWLMSLAPIAAAAVAVAGVLWFMSGSETYGAPTLALVPREDRAPTRGNEYYLGDELLVSVPIIEPRAVAEIRVYRDDGVLLVSCDGESPCRRENGILSLRFLLQYKGEFLFLILPGPRPKGLKGKYDSDMAADNDQRRVPLLSQVVPVR
jgi:hypothetical protein